ncbi:MAG: AraC family transcriptional regulator [bacterium]|nr:AraC family transcriptional regulator [bacterium]
MPQLSPSVSLHFLKAMLAACPRLGITLPATAGAWLQEHPEATRVPLEVQDSIWEEFCAASADPLIGLHLGRDTQPGNLDIVGLLLMSCDDLAQALEMLVDYQQIIGEGGEFFLLRGESIWRLRYESHFHCRARERVEAVFSTLLHLGRWVSGGAFTPDSIHFQHRAAAGTAAYHELLGCRTDFEARENEIVFPAAQAGLPLIQSNPSVTRHLRLLADQMLAGLGSQSLASQVQTLLQKKPAAAKEEVALQLHMSGRHLNRLLADENTSFKLLQDITRRQLAEKALRQADSRMADIAALLGFSDESAFAKAFRRWTGISPGQFREGS